MRFDFADQLHGAYFRCSAQRSRRESIDESFNLIRPFIQLTAHTADQMNHMTVILWFLIKQYPYIMAIT